MDGGGKSDSHSQVRRFAGEGDNPPKQYRQWKRWARAYLKVQASKGMSEDAFGSVLYTLLDGAALRAFDSVDMSEIEEVGGQDVIFQVLDERYPEEASHDRLGEVLDAVFDLKVDRGESTASFTGKVRAAFQQAEAEGIRFPSVARGYMVLRFAKLTPERRAVVLAAARRSYDENDIVAALRTTYPEGLHQGRSSANVVAEIEDDAAPIDDEQLAMVADEFDTDGNEPIDESDAVEVLLSWKETRAKIGKEKLARGFPTKGDVRKLETRVRCFKCKQVGHFSKNCTSRRMTSSSTSSAAASTKGVRVNFVNMVGAYAGRLNEDEHQSADAEIDAMVSQWEGQRRDYWQTDGDKVIRKHVIPRRSLFTPARTMCPVPITELSTARTTHVRRGDQNQEIYTGNWKHQTECHRDLGYEWTGETIFYREKAVAYDEPEAEEGEDEILSVAEALQAMMREYHGGDFQVSNDMQEWVDV